MELLVGAVLSIVVEIAKKFFGTTRIGTLVFFLTLSFLVSGAYIYLNDTPYFDTLIKIAGTAALVYGVVIKTWNESQE